MSLCTVRDVDWTDTAALVRVDFNVPMQDGAVADDTRIRAVLPTLAYLRSNGARVLLLSHLGRPDGTPNPKYSLEPIAVRLSELLGGEACQFASDCIGSPAESAANALGPRGVLLLENVRFHAEEEANDADFAAALARLGDTFVNDAFGAAHRAHASTEGLARHLPAVAGLLMEKEIAALSSALNSPDRPFVSVIGGAKVSSKLGVLSNLVDRVDGLLIGGGMANTFLKAQGREVGKSLLEPDLVPTARKLLDGGRVSLPVDVVVTTDLKGQAAPRTTSVDDVRADEMIVDIGPRTTAAYRAEIGKAGTVLWNGPMGVFEDERYAAGTLAIANAMAASNGTTVVGGGESVQAVEQAGVAERLTHVSTGGGASLEFIEGKVLPGVAALKTDCR